VVKVVRKVVLNYLFNSIEIKDVKEVK